MIRYESDLLTKRQREVLEMMAEGYTTKMIAYKLQISQRTVAAHIQTLHKVLGAETRPHAVHLAHQKGLIE